MCWKLVIVGGSGAIVVGAGCYGVLYSSTSTAPRPVLAAALPHLFFLFVCKNKPFSLGFLVVAGVGTKNTTDLNTKRESVCVCV